MNKRLDLTNLQAEITKRGISEIIVRNKKGEAFPKTPLIIGILNIPGFAILNMYYNVKHLTPEQIIFSDYPQYAGKILGALYSSLSVGLFFIFIYRKSRSTKLSVLIAFTYAFATGVFNTASQANWQHGISLLLINLLLVITTLKKSTISSLFFGFILGTLTLVRISNIFYLPFALLFFGKFHEKKWNFKYLFFVTFAFISVIVPVLIAQIKADVPYGYQDSILLALNTISPAKLLIILFSILFSINYGFFVYSPIFILCLKVIPKLIKDKSELAKYLVILLPTLCLFIIFNAIWPYWTGGTSLQARLLTETFPIWCLLLLYFLIIFKNRNLKLLFFLLLFLSITINIVTTFMIDGWWYRLYTKQTTQSQLKDAWYHKPSLFGYLIKTRIIYYETFKKEDNLIKTHFFMYRPTWQTKKIEKLYEKENEVLNLNE